MNKDIKEILDKLKDKDYYEELDLTGTKWIELKQEETLLLLDYITKLETYYNDNVPNYVDLVLKCSNLLDKKLEINNKIDKAIEYIKEYQRKDGFLNLNEWQTRDLLNILQGDDNNG